MITKIEKLETKEIDEKIITEAAEIIKSGGLVAFPTETVYGLGADALQPEASMKIYAAKGRPSDNPLIVHVASMDAVEKIVKHVPKQAKELAKVYWPGPLTMIFEKNEKVPYETTGGMDTVAIRMPNHPIALELIKHSGGYIAAPSANTSGHPSPTTAQHVYHDLKGRVPYIIDGGAVGIGLESTIVDFSVQPPMILRPGYITEDMVREVIGEVKTDPGLIAADSDIRPKAPGMKYRHYAPKAELTIVRGEQEAVVDQICQLAKSDIAAGRQVGIICTEETIQKYVEGHTISIGSRGDEDAIARHLFAVLRDFDEMDIDVIYSESFDTPRIGQAIMNRLLKAAGHKIIDLSTQEEKNNGEGIVH